MIVEKTVDSSTDAAQERVASILDRQKQLKRQRRNRSLQKLWRTGATLSATLALGWGLSQPDWKIQQFNQVMILGNTQLATETIARLLPLQIPASLIRIEPQTIRRTLQAHAHIDQVTVSRQLFPPQVTLVVQERSPVAQTTCRGCKLSGSAVAALPKDDTWLIDERGIVLPLSSYPALQESQKLPQLKVSGFLTPVASPDSANSNTVAVSRQKQQQWRQSFPKLAASPLQIDHLDWRDPKNIKLHTELGTVHLSNSLGKLEDQLQALNRMRSLPQQVDLQQVRYIDLSDPTQPSLELKSPPSPKPAAEP
ncbi:cell division protein FtsQ/DivIB [Lyngbya confervoides]|uniref:FtsQ-type POTRA domain-containing protein n=1 Tax=Lyngbya confervoides BDU141951 TaxID=1574623 RepID=A0ABD4T7A8_9CYAN|nr:FtsQ-type POTRA domain-containing protein [Lyngbya confervoides]MCM1984390.1 FtsQ-type POTRA domain-containing protein [Lyngbya confervoides BDU141951]